eukprot:g44076.t1
MNEKNRLASTDTDALGTTTISSNLTKLRIADASFFSQPAFFRAVSSFQVVQMAVFSGCFRLLTSWQPVFLVHIFFNCWHKLVAATPSPHLFNLWIQVGSLSFLHTMIHFQVLVQGSLSLLTRHLVHDRVQLLAQVGSCFLHIFSVGTS